LMVTAPDREIWATEHICTECLEAINAVGITCARHVGIFS
jgi:hypothetical protein